MTQEEKYNAAIEQAKKELATCGSMDCDAARLIFRLFPQLCESEDERIRKEMIDFLKSEKAFQTIDLPISERWISYLEKQKELFKSGRGLYYYDGEKTTYCGYPATEDNPYDFAISQQEKQKEQKPISFNEPYNPDDYEVVMEGNATSLKRKEQKPWKVGANAYFTPEQKPVEWSEEDKNRIQRICDFLWKNRKGDTDTIYQIEKDVDWLKSLRPDSYKNCNSRWKPSEEELVALKNVGGILRDYGHGELAKMVFMIEGKLANLSVINKSIWKPSEQEKSALRTAIYVLTDERSFPKTAAQLQNILNAFEGEESRKDWKPIYDKNGVIKYYKDDDYIYIRHN